MPKKKVVEFRFYEIPQGESALILCGDEWKRVYGTERSDMHFHNLYEIGICRSGLGEMVFDGQIHAYGDGVVTMIPANYPHTTVSFGDTLNFWEYLFFDPVLIIQQLFPEDQVYQKKALESLNKSAFYTTIEKNPAIGKYIDELIAEKNENKIFRKKISRLHMEALVLELLRMDSTLPEEKRIGPKGTNMGQITLAIDYISKNYMNEIRIADLADLCSLSETHFRRLFEELINMAPIEYINLVRIQNACELIKKSNYSMETVALRCGYTNVTTFNRNFKKILNTSPYHWKINPENYENKLLNFRISALKGW